MKNVNKKILELRIQQSDRLKEKFDEDSQEYMKVLEQAGYVLLSEPDNGCYVVEIYFYESLNKIMFSSDGFTDPNMAVADLIKQLETPITYFEYQGQHSSISHHHSFPFWQCATGIFICIFRFFDYTVFVASEA